MLEAALSDAGIPYTVARNASTTVPRCDRRWASSVAAAAEPEGAAESLLDAVLQWLGWKLEPPSGQGRQRERWESMTALRTMVAEAVAGHGGWTAGDVDGWLRERASWQAAAPVAAAVTPSTLRTPPRGSNGTASRSWACGRG